MNDKSWSQHWAEVAEAYIKHFGYWGKIGFLYQVPKQPQGLPEISLRDALWDTVPLLDDTVQQEDNQ